MSGAGQTSGPNGDGQLSDRDLLAFVQGELTEQERDRVELLLDASPEHGEVLAELARIFGPAEPYPDDSRQDTLDTTVDDISWAPVAGTTLGRYLVIGEIGRGGMGLVLRAYDPKLQREVALKCLAPGRMSSETQARLVREGQAMAKLNHPNVVSVYDVDVLDGRVVLAMEYVEGVDLGAWVERQPRGWREVLEAYVQAGRGLVAAHARGLLHRDFKPANVLLSSTGVVKVTDFGIARVDEAVEGEPTTGAPTTGAPTLLESGQVVFDGAGRLTEEGQVVGTPAYMPPEQFQGARLAATADQYAFCASLWQGLTGQLPFADRGGRRLEISTLARLKAGGPPRWPAGAPAVPRRLVDALTRGLEPEPAARWPSMEALLAALTADPSQRRRRLVGAGALVVVVVGGVGGQAYQRSAAREACEREGREIEDIWSAERAETVAEAFRRLGVTYAPESWERARPRVDAFVEQWAEARTEVCVGGELEGTISARLLTMSRACFDEQRALLGTLVDQWSAPNEEVAQRLGSAAWALRWPQRCADEVELLRRGDTSDDPELRGAEQALRERGAEAAARLQTGQYAAGLAHAEA
ncbi:MAG: serine/threonine protein kinase, partial [Myxococcales bacterium]|nr:serine/threonine protein kinase [Myxococcales bacterium]